MGLRCRWMVVDIVQPRQGDGLLCSDVLENRVIAGLMSITVCVGGMALMAMAAALSDPNVHADGAGPRAAAVSIAGKVFSLEVVDDAAEQARGLAGRAWISENGGMLFTFQQPHWQGFVMRDCPIPIDLLYLDERGTILDVFAMQPEPPRSNEERPGDESGDAAYTCRLKTYLSHAPSAFAIELRGGTIAALGVSEGDRVALRLDPQRTNRLSEPPSVQGAR